MTSGVDGSIIIDTKIDSKGANSGLKSLSGSLGGVLKSVMGVAKVLGAAFIGGSIINSIRSVIGSFDLMSSSIGGSVAALSASFGSLKGAFINLIATAFAPLIPYVTMFVNWLVTVFTTIAQIIAALFGMKATVGGVASAATGSGKAAKSAAKDAKKAAKDAAGALASFDQINVLSSQQDNANPDVPEPDAGGGGGMGGLPSLPSTVVPPELMKSIEDFKNKFLEFIQPVRDALGRLGESLKPLGQTIWEGLKWAWDNILVPLGTWVITDALPAFLDLLGAAAVILNDILVALQPALQWLWDNFLKPAADFVGAALIQFLEWVTNNMKEMHTWIQNNQQAWQIIVTILGIVALALLFILSPVALVIAAIIAIIAIIVNWGAIWDWIKEKSIAFWDAVAAKLTEIGTKWREIFTGIRDFTKGIINNILDFINDMIRSIVGGINGIIGSLNSVGSIIPGFSAVATISAPQIPHLATGAVIPANSQFMAVLGDQKSGRNIEAPEGLIRQIVSEEIGKIQADIRIGFSGSLAGLVRDLKPYIDKENVRVGGSLIKGSANV